MEVYLLFSFQNTKKFKEDKNHVYDRMADSFVALFTSTNKDVKDKFLSVHSIKYYHTCIGHLF